MFVRFDQVKPDGTRIGIARERNISKRGLLFKEFLRRDYLVKCPDAMDASFVKIRGDKRMRFAFKAEPVGDIAFWVQHCKDHVDHPVIRVEIEPDKVRILWEDDVQVAYVELTPS